MSCSEQRVLHTVGGAALGCLNGSSSGSNVWSVTHRALHNIVYRHRNWYRHRDLQQQQQNQTQAKHSCVVTLVTLVGMLHEGHV
jgi:hypothetical protein